MSTTAPRSRTILLAVGTASAVLAAAAFGGVFTPEKTASSQRVAATAPEGQAVLDQLGISTSEPTLEQLERQARDTGSASSFAKLGIAHLELVRTTGDPAGYGRADAALERALELDPKSYPALLGTATLAAARHRFPEALRSASTAAAIRPASTEALGIMGDAQVELGRYEAAFATFDKMAASKPSVASYARVSYGRELIGDRRGAIEAMSLALEVSTAGSEPRAFALINRGNLLMGLGDPGAAMRDYDAALQAVPDYPAALIGKSRLAFAQGDADSAVALAERAAAASGLPEHAMALGDILRATGREGELPRARRLVDETVAKERSVGALLDFELAVWNLDHGHDLAGALEDIERTWATRRSVGVADAMAWALVKNGRCEAARPYSAMSMRIGGVDGIKGFHRAEIERCLGNGAAAKSWYRRALAADPSFSVLHVARARAGASAA